MIRLFAWHDLPTSVTPRTTNAPRAQAIAALDPLTVSIVMTATAVALITPNLVTARCKHVGVEAGCITQYFIPLIQYECLCCHACLLPNRSAPHGSPWLFVARPRDQGRGDRRTDARLHVRRQPARGGDALEGERYRDGGVDAALLPADAINALSRALTRRRTRPHGYGRAIKGPDAGCAASGAGSSPDHHTPFPDGPGPAGEARGLAGQQAVGR